MRIYLIIFLFISLPTYSEDTPLARDLPEVGSKEAKEKAMIKNTFRYKNEWKEMIDVEKKIQKHNFKLNCNTDFDCKAVAVGEKLCGGPAGFIVMSNLDPDLKGNEDLIADYTNRVSALKKQLTVKQDSCEFMTAPALKCDKGQCVETN